MDKYRLVRKLLMGLTAVGLAYFMMDQWPSRPIERSVASFCATVSIGSPVRQLLIDAVGRELSTTFSEDLLRVYNTNARDRDECEVSHSRGIVTSRELLSRR